MIIRTQRNRVGIKRDSVVLGLMAIRTVDLLKCKQKTVRVDLSRLLSRYTKPERSENRFALLLVFYVNRKVYEVSPSLDR